MRIEKINGIRYNHDAPSESGEPTRLITQVTYPSEYDGVRGELDRSAWFMNDGNIGSDDWPLEVFTSTLHAPCENRINFLETLHSYNRPVCCTHQTAAKLVATYGGRLKDYGRLLDCTDTYVWTPDTYDAVLTAPGSAVDEPTDERHPTAPEYNGAPMVEMRTHDGSILYHRNVEALISYLTETMYPDPSVRFRTMAKTVRFYFDSESLCLELTKRIIGSAYYMVGDTADGNTWYEWTNHRDSLPKNRVTWIDDDC